jgi:hypothetical protein
VILDAPLTGNGINQNIPCDDVSLDVFAMQLTDGTNVAISVDTVSAETAFRAELLVVSPNLCVVSQPYGMYSCAYNVDNFPCPGMSFTAIETGTYLVAIRNSGACNSTDGEYNLIVEGATATLLADDVTDFERVSRTSTRITFAEAR